MTPALHFIGGRFTDLGDSRRFESVDPATYFTLGEVSDAGEAGAAAAMAEARAAFDRTDWAHDPRRRAAALLEIADRLEARSEEIAALLTAENGKILAQSRLETANAISMCRYNAGLARSVSGRVTEVEPGRFSMLPREALGVAAVIVPWNAPVGLLFRSLAAALAAGCTVVVKAHPLTALVTTRLFEIMAGVETIPAGVVNLFHEQGDAGAKALVASPTVDVISYTGSTPVGKRIMAAAAPTLKRLNLELGGSTPCIVFGDADLARALPALVRAGMVFAGQQCVAASRILVHRSLEQEVAASLTGLLSRVVVGRGADTGVQMGPLIDRSNRDRVAAMVVSAGTNNEILLKGTPLPGTLADGAFLTPSLVRVRDRQSHVVREEVFGPVLSLDVFDDDEEAVSLVNDSRMGLAASIWGGDFSRLHRAANAVRVGTVWINEHGRFAPEAEVGGYRESGLGCLFGPRGLDDFLQLKNIAWSLET